MIANRILPIRRAALDDGVGLARVQVAGWRTAYRGIFPDDFLANFTVEKRTLLFEQRLGDPNYPSDREWLYERDGEVVGWLSWMPSRDDDDDARFVAEVAALYVHPSTWGMGIGATLMDHIHDYLSQLGSYRETTLWVLEKNHRARRFYERQGYRDDRLSKTQPKFQDIKELRYRRFLEPPSAP